MRDPQERSAPLAVRGGGPAPVRVPQILFGGHGTKPLVGRQSLALTHQSRT
jgi:hypothetical protein